jgi:curli biogenesis system outer membrane secretion channel CsgG
MNRLHRLFFIAVIVIAAFAAIAATKATTTPGKYTEWGPDIDSIEIVKSFKFSDYASVAVEKLDGTATPKPEDADLNEKFEKVKSSATEPFLEGIKKGLPKAAMADAQASGDRVLLVRGKIATLDPGSRSKRVFFGIYGAGAARAAITGEIVDARSGEVLIRFTQERRSGIEKFGRGSSYEEIMKRNLTALGEDVTNILKVF